jgi:hypothetical protein
MRDRVSDILDAIAKIKERIRDSADAFQQDEMGQIAGASHCGTVKGIARRRR